MKIQTAISFGLLLAFSTSAYSQSCRDYVKPGLTPALDEACKKINNYYSLSAVLHMSRYFSAPTVEQVLAASKIDSLSAATLIGQYPKDVSPEIIEAIAEVDTISEQVCVDGYDGIFNDPSLEEIKYCTSQEGGKKKCHTLDQSVDKARELASDVDQVVGAIDPNAKAKSSSQIYYKWDGAGFCNEHAPNGATIEKHVARYLCEAVAPSVYKFDAGGYCNKLTPSGSVIESHVSKMHCR